MPSSSGFRVLHLMLLERREGGTRVRSIQNPCEPGSLQPIHGVRNGGKPLAGQSRQTVPGYCQRSGQ